MKKADLVTSIAHKHQLPRGKTQDVIEDLLEELAAAPQGNRFTKFEICGP